MSDTVKNKIQALIDRETQGLNSKNRTYFSTLFIQTWFGRGPPRPAITTQFSGNLCWGDFKEIGGGNISRRFLTNTNWLITSETPSRLRSHLRKMRHLQFWISICCGVTRTQNKRSRGRAGFVNFTREAPAESGNLFSRPDHWIMWEGTLPKDYPPKERRDCPKIQPTRTTRSRKHHSSSWTDAAYVPRTGTASRSPSNFMRRIS